MKIQKLVLVFFLCLFSSAAAFGQGTISGRIVEADNSTARIIGASVIVKNTTKGSVTDIDGKFKLDNVTAGEVNLVISFIGFETVEKTVSVSDGQNTDIGTVELSSSTIGLNEVEVIASIAIDRKTPVAVSTIKKDLIAEIAPNAEFTEIMKSAPSVYVTKDGGGYGDGRINIRGFSSNNLAVLINGVPVNDMENGRVFWSNWAGLTDVASSVQMQRGLSASRLAISSVGGSINVITNAAERTKGTKANLSVGNDGYLKVGVSHDTGVIGNGLAVSLQFSHARGNGWVDGTKFRGYNYFASISKVFNEKHTINLTALGAPQWHHQRQIGRFDGVSLDQLRERGRRYNPQWGTLDGEEFTWRRNFYHKPKVYLNHYWTINDKTELNTTAYVSFGRGGGTGAYGRLNGGGFGFNNDPVFKNAEGQIRFDDLVAFNRGQSSYDFVNRGSDVSLSRGTFAEELADGGRSFGVTPSSGDLTAFGGQQVLNTARRNGFLRRASINSHDWVGAISQLTHELNDEFTLFGGLDLRSYNGIHYRRVDNLLGNDALFEIDNRNLPNGKIVTQEKTSGALTTFADDDQIDYYNIGKVRWIGTFGQLEYSNGSLSAFLSGAVSNQSYQRVDFFVDHTDTPKTSDTHNQIGGNVKIGANYNINAHHNVFFNTGLISRQPFFDAVFPNFGQDINADVENEQVTSLEIGYGLRMKGLTVNINAYSTRWSNRFLNAGGIRYTNAAGDEIRGSLNLPTVGQIHNGLEIDANYQLAKWLEIGGQLSLGDWQYDGDIEGIFIDNETQLNIPEANQTVKLNGVKVGDAAQTTASLRFKFMPIKGLSIIPKMNAASDLFADLDPTSSAFRNEDKSDDNIKAPSYAVWDLGIFYNTKIGKMNTTFRFTMDNMFDTHYIADLKSNNPFDPAQGETLETENFGFFGFGRTWSTGVSIKF